MVKINIISGFLGAGKTTLIKKLLGGSIRSEKVILLENEYGEVGIDGGFMKDAGITVTELNSGCICCTLAGDFQTAIDELIGTYHPDRLIVEPTGVGKLSEIIAAVNQAKERHELEITGCATVVDAGKCRMYLKNYGEFYTDQVKSAATVIFSRTQLLPAERVEKSRALISEVHPGVRIITTPWDELDADQILDVIESGEPIEIHVELHHHHDEDDDDAHEHEHHHDHDDDGEHEHEHHHEHHHDDDDDDDDEHEHEHHHDHDHEHHHHHHHHHAGEHDADEVFDNIGVETANRYTQDQIRELVAQLSDEEEFGMVLRAKGILQTPDGAWFQFDYVPGELQLRDGSADYTGRLAIIGTHLEESALKALFNV